jgi:hemerythrin-like domain-containing protein
VERFVLFRSIMEPTMTDIARQIVQAVGPEIYRGRTGAALTPTAVLRADHDVILGVLRAMTRVLDDGGHFDDTAFWRDVLTFMRDFVYGAHDRKEEAVLFPKLEMCGVERSHGPIGVMLAEHEEAQALLARLAQEQPALATASEEACDRFLQTARKYCALLVSHIARENGVLFPMADALLSPDDRDDVLRRFALWDQDSTAACTRESMLAVAGRVQRAAKEHSEEQT